MANKQVQGRACLVMPGIISLCSEWCEHSSWCPRGAMTWLVKQNLESRRDVPWHRWRCITNHMNTAPDETLCASLHSEVLVRSWGIHGPVLHPCVRGLLHHSLHKATGSSAQTRRAANARLKDLRQRQPHGHQATAGQQLQQHIWKT